MTFDTLELLDNATRLHYKVTDATGVKSVSLEMPENFSSSAISSKAISLYDEDPYESVTPLNMIVSVASRDISSSYSISGIPTTILSSVKWRVNGEWQTSSGSSINTISLKDITVNGSTKKANVTLTLSSTGITVTSDSMVAVIYGEATPTVTVALTGLIIDDTVIYAPGLTTTKEGYYDLEDANGMYVLWAKNFAETQSFSMIWDKAKIFKAITSVITDMQREVTLVTDTLLNFIFKVEIFEKCWNEEDYTNAIKIWQKYFASTDLLKNYIPKCNA